MSLYASQIKAFKSAEPKTLGAIEIIFGVFTVILSSIVYKLHYHIQREIIILIVNGAQLVITGVVLVHTGRKPSKCLVLTTIVLQLLTAAFDIVGFGLMARHIPFRGESYYYRDTEFLVNGILVTLIGFLVLACVIGLVVSLFGVYALSVSAIKELTPIPHSTANQHYGAGVHTQNMIHAGN
ncbi:uncharacterized protein si:dkey-7j14.5 isoform X2 [Onychostoma macrolepis]|uniref:Uncharacterized protein n=1 Tax=Onychostoma macrolepis TaxID=369639 RepID=A0A7J6C6K1_9TELE|nr:uncharacterized protein si:dkey-7j14.5 isoform X2 [Onychostoma macrolepis]KAF4102860.1 hypothetical protein G5714_015743 [Onychostoma macrolepis]